MCAYCDLTQLESVLATRLNGQHGATGVENHYSHCSQTLNGQG
jgi:hypothetical protein